VICLGFRVWGTPGSGGQVVLRTLPELVWRSVQNLVEIGPAVRAWKRDIGTISLFYTYTSQPGPGADQEKFNEIKSPIRRFYFTESFLSRDPLGYPGVQGSGLQGHACVMNLPWVGVEVCGKFGGDWSGSSGVKSGHRYKQSLLYI